MGEKYTLSCLVENQFGVLARMAGLISARAFNIDSLTVSATEDPSVSHMTIVVDADPVKLEQVKRQLGRLIDVIDVKELDDRYFIGRDLLLVRVQVGEEKAALEKLMLHYHANIADVDGDQLVIEAVGKTKTIDELIDRLRSYKIVKLVRAGRVALEKS